MNIDPALSQNDSPSRNNIGEASSHSSNSDNLPFNDLQNPSDALDILAQIASNDGRSHQQDVWQDGANEDPRRMSMASAPLFNNHWANEGLDYKLVRSGQLSSGQIIRLIERYRQLYHPYFALVPPNTLDTRNLSSTAQHEPHLLTAILVIASKDLSDEPHVFAVCTEYMQSLVSSLAAGGEGGVEAVEALLLLAEWTPYTSSARSGAGQVGRGEEDREAWMSVGLALRIGYYLGMFSCYF